MTAPKESRLAICCSGEAAQVRVLPEEPFFSWAYMLFVHFCEQWKISNRNPPTPWSSRNLKSERIRITWKQEVRCCRQP